MNRPEMCESFAAFPMRHPRSAQRWQAADSPQAWSGIRQATQFGTPALQGETFAPRSAQSENCLFLNIWTPANATADSKLPVLFWIHGGAFIQGSGAQPRYDGTELAKRGAVVISINYRLGSLGLFPHPALTAESTPDEPLGNYCLLDMIAALHGRETTSRHSEVTRGMSRSPVHLPVGRAVCF